MKCYRIGCRKLGTVALSDTGNFLCEEHAEIDAWHPVKTMSGQMMYECPDCDWKTCGLLSCDMCCFGDCETCSGVGYLDPYDWEVVDGKLIRKNDV